MGNWSHYTVQQMVLGTLTTTLDQQRTPSPANEITAFSNSTGRFLGSGRARATAYYDATGNMTTAPEPGSEANGLACVYDAWNRLVSVSVGGTEIAGYTYLCLCQLAVADFSALSILLSAKLTRPLRWTGDSRSFCYRRSQGTSRCSFAHRSMAA